MYCAHCGRQMEHGSRFCPACGAAVPWDQSFGGTSRRALVRPREGRAIAGVCAAFALAYGWDLALVRAIAVISLLFSGGTVALAYFVFWVAIPEAPYSLPHTTTTGTTA